MNHAFVSVVVSTGLFAAIHSATASFSCKRQAERYGLTPLLYRRLYVLFSLLLTAIWFFWLQSLPDSPLYAVEGAAHWLMRALQGLGVVIAVAAFAPINTAAFLGLRHQPTGDPFVVSGIYRHIRHPMYAGLMLILLAQPVQSINHATLSILLCLYCLIGSRLEEARMIAQHPEYVTYRRSTPAWIPVLPFRK